jgi:hypothetical protein
MNSDNTTPESPRANRWIWCGLTLFLLAWNLVPALHANPFTLIQVYDGAQYQLLTRNRLQGHGEIGDAAHTVRTEGWHPMWRPGLVWIQEGLARAVGSVQLAAGLASGLGTTLLELAMLWLTWRCFGRGTCLLLLLILLVPMLVSVHFLRMAVGQGPEPWALAAVLGGLSALYEARERRSWTWAILAGVAGGLSEWFRTGNLILFGVPCAVYALGAWRQRNYLGCALPAVAVAAFVASATVCEWVVPSEVNKTTANLWGNIVEREGPGVDVSALKIEGMTTMHVGGLTLAPGSLEAYYDYLVRRSREQPALVFFWEHREQILSLYLDRLGRVAASGARGLRRYTGEALLIAFLVQVVLSLRRRDALSLHVLALASTAVTFYLGPVVFLQGDYALHYLLLILPFVLMTATRGLVEIMLLMHRGLESVWPLLVLRLQKARTALLALALIPALWLTGIYYHGALDTLESTSAKAAEEQTALDGLELAGRKIACRNMSWFVDRPVQTVLLPFADVPQLEAYARHQGIDGILIWEHEPAAFLWLNPCGSLTDMDRALRGSTLFGQPQVSGGWRWYPVRHSLAQRRNPPMHRGPA